jgi:hypothetical protein
LGNLRSTIRGSKASNWWKCDLKRNLRWKREKCTTLIRCLWVMLIVLRHRDCALLQITFVLFILYYVCKSLHSWRKENGGCQVCLFWWWAYMLNIKVACCSWRIEELFRHGIFCNEFIIYSTDMWLFKAVTQRCKIWFYVAASYNLSCVFQFCCESEVHEWALS